jgi:hypothetical protein
MRMATEIGYVRPVCASKLNVSLTTMLAALRPRCCRSLTASAQTVRSRLLAWVRRSPRPIGSQQGEERWANA